MYSLTKTCRDAAVLCLVLVAFGLSASARAGELGSAVERLAALALCMIFDVEPISGRTVYGVRSLDDENRKVRAFWRQRVETYRRTGE